MRKKVLLAEYDLPTVQFIQDQLPSKKVDVVVVEDGALAKDMLQHDTFDLLISAAMLPKVHGFELSQFVANHHPKTQTILISGVYKGIEYKHQAISQFHALDFFEKPLNKNGFLEKVTETLELTNGKDKGEAEEKKISQEELFGDLIREIEEPETEMKKKSEKSTKSKPKKSKTKKSKPKPKPQLQPKSKSQPNLRENHSQVDDMLKSMGIGEEESGVAVGRTSKSENKEKKKTSKPPKSSEQKDVEKVLEGLKDVEAASSNQPRAKKIETEISNKFEMTLKDLGLTEKKKPKKQTQMPEPVEENVQSEITENEDQADLSEETAKKPRMKFLRFWK